MNTLFKLPYYWVHEESGCLGVELDLKSVKHFIKDPLCEPCDKERWKQLADSGNYQVCLPVCMDSDDREDAFNNLSEIQHMAQLIQGYFQNPGLDIKENWEAIQGDFAKLQKQLTDTYNHICATPKPQIPVDFIEEDIPDEYFQDEPSS